MRRRSELMALEIGCRPGGIFPDRHGGFGTITREREKPLPLSAAKDQCRHAPAHVRSTPGFDIVSTDFSESIVLFHSGQKTFVQIVRSVPRVRRGAVVHKKGRIRRCAHR